MNELTVREAGLEELGRIAEMKKQIHDLHVNGRPDLFAPIRSLTPFAQNAAARSCALLIAEWQGEPAGYAILQYVDRSANPYMHERHYVHVEEFCVDERYRRRGVGTALMQALRALAREKGYPRIELDVWAFNQEARQFYEAAGMKAFRTFMEMDTAE